MVRAAFVFLLSIRAGTSEQPRHNILQIPQAALQLFDTFPFVRAKEMHVLTETKDAVVCFIQAFIVSRLIYTGSHRI